MVGLFSLYEGLPNTVCEAMCLAKPVITSNVSDSALLIDDHNLIPEPTNPEDISRSISYLMNMEEIELLTLGRHNREKAVKLFS